MTAKPQLSFWQIWNMCFGFMGIQIGFALQNANVSRIFQTLGADMSEMAVLWVAAPITGLLVQPIIGYYSDKTWTRLGRRRPYFLWGAILSTAAIFIMPNSPTLWIAAGMLWIMDASINVSMEPFRAFVGDMLPEKQRAKGYAMQSFFIGIGAVVASAAPWIMTNWFDVQNTAAAGELPDSVKYAFYFGGVCFLLAVLWTIVRTKEYSPDQLAEFAKHQGKDISVTNVSYQRQNFIHYGFIFILVGLSLSAAVSLLSLDKELFILTIGFAVFGIVLFVAGFLQKINATNNGYSHILSDLFEMPVAMKQLAVVQFFSWFALFSMWIYSTSAVTSYHFGSSDTTSLAFNDGANWQGILMAAYNGVAAIAAILIPKMVTLIGIKKAHLVNLFLGGLGLISFKFINNPDYLLLSMVGVGFAWASILSLPYALLANQLPDHKLGVYMGIFNFFITVPQILAASILGFILTTFFNGEPIYALVVGGVSLMLGGLSVLRIKE